MVSARSSMAAWALFCASMVLCATADQRTVEQAKASKDLLNALDNADLSDLLENDLDEAFLFRRRSHAGNLKSLNIHGQIDRLLQDEVTPVSTVSPTVSPTASPTASSSFEVVEGGNMPSGTATPSSISTDREGGGDDELSQREPDGAPTDAPVDLSSDAFAAWRRPTSRLLGGVLIGVVTGMTMTAMVAL